MYAFDTALCIISVIATRRCVSMRTDKRGFETENEKKKKYVNNNNTFDTSKHVPKKHAAVAGDDLSVFRFIEIFYRQR